MISVIVPYKDAEPWITRCVESMKIQKGDAEFILVNDHSSDSGKKIAKELTKGDKRFKHVDNARAAGVSGARNTGIDKAKGEWITFLDADDELMPEAFQVFDRMIRLDPTINIMQANHMRNYTPERTVLKYANSKGTYSMKALPKCWCMVWNKLVRRSFIEENQIRFVEGLQYGEDEIFVLDMLAKDDRIIHTMTNTVTILRHFDNKQSLSHVKPQRKEGLLAQARALEDYIMRTEDPLARITACKVLSEHWGSNTYIKAFGRAEE